MERKVKTTHEPERAGCAMEIAKSAEPVPTHDQVRFRAYEMYEARRNRGGSGDALADWICAECELMKHGKNK